MRSRNPQVMTALLAVVALTLAACSSSNTPEDNTADTTPPTVTSTSPANGGTSVLTNAAITVIFNEDMAPASATGQVQLSSGGLATTTWLDTRTVSITHGTGWAEGVQVTVTLGVGLTDAAGNALTAPYVFSFFTDTTALLLINNEPLNNATGVNRSASVRLQFSRSVDESSLSDHVTITSPEFAKATYPFTVTGGGANNWVTLDPAADLPASTTFTVTVGADVNAAGSPSTTLGTPSNFTFTTGVDVDTTPPTILSVSPANGSTNVAADVGALVITFSEPIAPDSFSPVAWNAEFAVLIMGASIEPVWSGGGTVLTVSLPSPLPTGLEMAVTMAGYTDLSGNAQATETAWTAKVAGTADIYPMADLLQYAFVGSWSRGPEGSSTPTSTGEQEVFRQAEVQLNGDVRMVGYTDSTYTTMRRWDAFDRLANQVNWLGFANDNGGGTVEVITFDSALKYLPLPMAAGTWTASSTVTVPGQGTFNAVLSGRVWAREDLAMPSKTPTGMYYKGAWKVARSMSVTLDGTWFTTMADTVWYSPTLGPVQEITREDNAARDGQPADWYRTEVYRR